MKVTGSVRPEKIWVRYVENGSAVVRLRTDVEEAKEGLFEYQEVELTLTERDDIERYIEQNFDALFAHGIKQESEPKPKTDKDIINDQMDYLVDLDFRLMQIELGF